MHGWDVGERSGARNCEKEMGECEGSMKLGIHAALHGGQCTSTGLLVVVVLRNAKNGMCVVIETNGIRRT